MNQFGIKIKELRIKQGLLQKHIASSLNIDTPMLSKIERGERKAKREQIEIFSQILSFNKDDLLSLWLADQICYIVRDENVALKAIHVAEKEIKYKTVNNEF